MATATSPKAESRLIPLEPVERDTIPKIFLRGVERFSRPDALRYKEGEAWKTLSHREVEERVTRLAAALSAAGIVRGDRIALLSENRPEWAITDYAVLGLGAVNVPVYATLPPNQIAYILEDAGARAILVSTREQLEKVLEIRDGLPALEQVIAFDDPGGAEGVRSLAEVLEEGRAAIEEGKVGNFREECLRVGRDDLATLIYTSGTTGNPKGVMLTHHNVASNVAGVHQHGAIEVHPGDVALSFLPLSHSFERMVDYYYWDAGATIAYSSIDDLAENLAAVAPHVMAAAPRVFEKIYTRVMGQTGLKGKLVQWAKGVGEKVAEEQLAGRATDGGFQYRLADKLVFAKLRARTGGRVRAFVSGSAPLSADIARFFFAAGMPIYEGYGLTETSPVLTVNKPGAVRLGTVGQPIPGVQIRIAESGEILARGPNVMKGYWNNPDATAEDIEEDGWFHTGDVGELDEADFLRITDRIKNLIVTAGGKNIAPQPMENLAAMSPYVSQVVMIGDRRPFPSLLVVPDFENLAAWAKEQGIDASDPRRLAEDPRVKELLEKETLSRLEGFARYERPKKVSVVPEEFTIESGILTPTLKVKRRVVEERYRDEIERIYEGKAVPE